MSIGANAKIGILLCFLFCRNVLSLPDAYFANMRSNKKFPCWRRGFRIWYPRLSRAVEAFTENIYPVLPP